MKMSRRSFIRRALTLGAAALVPLPAPGPWVQYTRDLPRPGWARDVPDHVWESWGTGDRTPCGSGYAVSHRAVVLNSKFAVRIRQAGE